MILELAEYKGGNMQSRYLINGRRVGRDVFENIKYLSNHWHSLMTVARGGGRFTHHMSVTASRRVIKDLLRGCV